jgi:asparagine N-glycosylation enzyme membrane subunit Stt3
VTTSSSSASPILAAPVVVVMSTLGTVSGVKFLDGVYEEGASIANSVMVGVVPVAAAPAVESGARAGSPPP